MRSLRRRALAKPRTNPAFHPVTRVKRNHAMRHHLKSGLWSLFATFLLCLSLSAVTFAQEETAAAVNGQVTDSTGATIAGATIVITNNETGVERRVETNEDG